MTIDFDAANSVLVGLRPFPVAVTTIDDDVANGLMSLSAYWRALCRSCRGPPSA